MSERSNSNRRGRSRSRSASSAKPQASPAKPQAKPKPKPKPRTQEKAKQGEAPKAAAPKRAPRRRPAAKPKADQSVPAKGGRSAKPVKQKAAPKQKEAAKQQEAAKAKDSAPKRSRSRRPAKPKGEPRSRSSKPAPEPRLELEAKCLNASAVFPAPLLVGCIKTAAGLDLLRADEVPADVIEVRVDELVHAGVKLEAIEAAMRARKHPALLTVRANNEGGAHGWKRGERTGIFLRLISHADAVDLELESLSRLQRVQSVAAQEGVHVILSVHSIQQPASNDQLRSWVHGFLTNTAFCYKMAMRLNRQSDLHQLVDILLRNPHKRWALMGLGPDAPRSRSVLTGLGSALAYGYLDKPTAPGQPSTKQLIKSL